MGVLKYLNPFFAATCSLNMMTWGNALQSFSARTYEALHVKNFQGVRRKLWLAAEAVNPFNVNHCQEAYRDELPMRTYTKKPIHILGRLPGPIIWSALAFKYSPVVSWFV